MQAPCRRRRQPDCGRLQSAGANHPIFSPGIDVLKPKSGFSTECRK